MCGLAGFLSTSGLTEAQLTAIAGRMADAQAHRGPDDRGVWVDPAAGVALGFRRLAILDTSSAGHQPMESASGRFVVTFNGEIYNFADIRRELEGLGHRFHSHSDTEVILASVEQWGVRRAVERFVGMFALVFWDRAERRLSLVRDRLGIKPMYVYREPGLVAWSSEVRGLLAGPSFAWDVDPNAVASYLRYLYVPAPRAFFRSVEKLHPGHILSIQDPDRVTPSEPYWSVRQVALAGQDQQLEGSDDEVLGSLETLLREAVRLRMIADVPVGALLSGGIDSSTVVALMQAESNRPVKTYTIGFDSAAYDEGSHAAAVAKAIGTEHTELRLTGDDVLNRVPRLWDMLDEPIADPSILPTFLVSELARREVTVALTGDGGDELFAGYNRYVYGDPFIKASRRLPASVRRTLSELGGRMGGDAASHRSLRGRVAKLTGLLGLESAGAMYQSLHVAWADPNELVPSATDGDGVFAAALAHGPPADLLGRMQLIDQQVYLPDDLLAKVDRASMAVSLEARVPLLDHRVVEFAWRLPRRFKIRGFTGKWALRQVLYKHVPRRIVDRPKMGFSVPIEAWLKGPLREWGGDLLLTSRSRGLDCVDWSHAMRAWEDFQKGQRYRGLAIWAMLVLAAWHQQWRAEVLEPVAS